MKITPSNAVVASLAVLGCNVAGACSLVRSYVPFRLGPTIQYTEVLSPAPELSVEQIRRGEAGEPSACANWGSVLIKVPAGDVGYSFELVESRGSTIRFPTGFVRSSSGYAFPASLRFYWDDGAVDTQESFELVVRVTAVSRDGVFSEPTVVRIEHPGVRAVR